MSAGGKNGTVKTAATGPSGNSAKVEYPEDPGPPIIPAHVEIYTDIPANVFLVLTVAAMTEGAKVDCTVDASGTVNGATGHRQRMDPLSPEVYVPAFSAMALALGVLYYDNKMLIKALIELTTTVTKATDENSANTKSNTEAVDRLTERINRGD